MKGYWVNCVTCGTKFKKKTNHHKHCGNSCRNRSSRKRNNIPEPAFMGKIKRSEANRADLRHKSVKGNELPLITLEDQESPEYAPTNGMELSIQTEMNYWNNVIRDANTGVLPLWTIGLASVGGIKFKNPIAAIVGGIIGNEIDKSRAISKQDKAIEVIAQAQFKIDELKARMRNLKKLSSSVKTLLKDGKLKTNNFGNIIEAEDYKTQFIKTLGYKNEWKYLFGDPAPGYYLLFTGLPGNGKTTAAIKLGDYHNRNFGRTIYLSSEQRGINKPFQNLLKENNAEFTIDTNPTSDVRKLEKQLSAYSMVIFDSINHLNIDPEGIEIIRKKNPNLCIVAIMQSTKDGNHKGSQEYLHNCDIRINMVEGKAIQTKSRYSPKSEIEIFS